MYKEDNILGNNIIINDGGITYHYSDKVKQQSLKTISDTYSEIREKSSKNKEFFDDLNVYVYGLWDEADDKNSNLNYFIAGKAFYPVFADSKSIYLKTNRSFKASGNYYDLGALIYPTIDLDKLKTNALHELGHIFDYNFAKPDSELVSKMKKIIKSTDDMKDLEANNEFVELYEQYCKQNGLSDSDEFKEAWKKDVQIAFKGQSRRHNNKLMDKLYYFSPKIFDGSDESAIILEDGINDAEMDLSDKTRQEVFAQLFAYAMGADCKGFDKHLIINTYKHSYEVVKNFINEYLGTNEKGHYVPRNKNVDCKI